MGDETRFSVGRRLGGLTLVARLPETPDGERWAAEERRTDGAARRVTIERIPPARAQDPAYRSAFLASCRRAQRLAHPHVVRMLGPVEVEGELLAIGDWPGGIDLAELMKAQALTPRLAVWLVREATHILVETATQLEGSRPDRVHGSLNPSRIHLSEAGTVELSGFGVDPALDPGSSDIAALVAILAALVPAPRPEAVEALIDPASFRDLRALESGLSRVFYAEMDGDDVAHGQDALAEAVGAQTGVPTAVATKPQAVEPVGALTLALEARRRPVMPQPLTIADEPTGYRPDQASSRPAKKPARSARPASRRLSMGPVVTAIFWFTLGFVFAIGLVIAERTARPQQPAASVERR